MSSAPAYARTLHNEYDFFYCVWRKKQSSSKHYTQLGKQIPYPWIRDDANQFRMRRVHNVSTIEITQEVEAWGCEARKTHNANEQVVTGCFGVLDATNFVQEILNVTA